MAPIALAQPSPIESLKAAVANGTVRDVAKPPDLTAYAHFDSTPSIGTEFRAYSPDGAPVLDIRTVLADDAKIKALGRLVSERGVVFFRDAVLSPQEQLELVDKLGQFGGKPATSRLHIHPCTLAGSELGDEVSVISNDYTFDTTFARDDKTILQRPIGEVLWHSDVTFEPVPSDYATLQIRTFPKVGGDTVWASAYEAYDRLSPAYQRFLEGLTATHIGSQFHDVLARARVADPSVTFREPRGAPENAGQELQAVHPVVRTNPLTGWKGLFVNRGFTKRINELTKGESDDVLEFLFKHISANHDLQVRFRWEPNNLAIWDNRSTFHAATYDLDGDKRVGTRSVSVGERPYFDPSSKHRRADLRERAQAASAAA
ncbi:hypothetical protein Q5752_002748 [Cryptotrichosporon argae]